MMPGRKLSTRPEAEAGSLAPCSEETKTPPETAEGVVANVMAAAAPPSPSEVLRPSENLPEKRRSPLTVSEKKSREAGVTSPSKEAKSSPPKNQVSPTTYFFSAPSTSGQKDSPKFSEHCFSVPKPRIVEALTIRKDSSKSSPKMSTTVGSVYDSKSAELGIAASVTSFRSPLSVSRVPPVIKSEGEAKRPHLMPCVAEKENAETSQIGASPEKTKSQMKIEEHAVVPAPKSQERARPPLPSLLMAELFDAKSHKRRLESSGSEKDSEDTDPSTPFEGIVSNLENKDSEEIEVLPSTFKQITRTAPTSMTASSQKKTVAASSTSINEPEDKQASPASANLDSGSCETTTFSVEVKALSDLQLKEDHFSVPITSKIQRPETLALNRVAQTSAVVSGRGEVSLKTETPSPRSTLSNAGNDPDCVSTTSTDAETPSKSEGTIDSGVASLSATVNFPSEQRPSCAAEQEDSQKGTEESESVAAPKSHKTGAKDTSPKKKMKQKKILPRKKSGKYLKLKISDDLYTETVCAAASGSYAVAYELAKHPGEAADHATEERPEAGNAPEKAVETEQPLESTDAAGSETDARADRAAAGSDGLHGELISAPAKGDGELIDEEPMKDLSFSDVEKMSEHTEDWITYVTDDSEFDYDRRFQDFDDEDSSDEKDVAETSDEEETHALAGTSARTRVREVIRRGGPAAQLLLAVRSRDDSAAAVLATPHLVQLAPEVCNRALAVAAAANMPSTVKALMKADANPLWRMPQQGEGHGTGRTAAHRATEAGAVEALSVLIATCDQPRRLARASDNGGKTPLHIAARRGDIHCLRILLSVVMDPQARTADEETPLHSAAMGGSVEAVELLLSSGAAVNAFRRGIETALHLAAYYRHSDIVSVLISAGANVNAVDEFGNAALFVAIDREAPPSLVRALVAAGADVDRANANGVTAVHAAATRRAHGALEMLLAAGARPDAANAGGCTPLHLSAFTAQIRKFEILLPLTPNAIDRKTQSGCSPFHSAVLGGNLDLVQTTVSLGANIAACATDGSNAVHMAASTDHVSVLRYLLSKGLNVNSRATNGSTPLHEASTAEVVDVLLHAGADGQALMKRNETALHRAATLGHAAVIRRLAQCLGMNVDMRQVDGLSPLQIAAYHGREAAVLELVRLGADVSRYDSDTPSPIMSVSRHGLVRAVEALANAGARADQIESNNDTTPLHEAVLHQNDQVLEPLVNLAGADINQRDGAGSTPLHHAARFNNSRLLWRLIALGADPLALDAYGMPPVHYAEHLSFKHCIDKLKAMARLPFGAYSTVKTARSALAGGQTDSVALARSFLRDYRVDVRRRRRDGKKALHLCCMFGFEAQVRGLLVLGDDPSAPMSYSLRPLHLAAAHGHVSIISALLDAGVDIEARRDNVSTALHEAALYGRREAVRELVRRGADPRARQASGRSPAHLAASGGHIGCIEELALDPQFDINDRDALNISTLHYAAQSGSALLVRWLVERGALLDATDRSGRTPLFHAVYRGRESTIKELISLGANALMRDNSEDTAIEYARKHLYLQPVYRLLIELIGNNDDDFEISCARISRGE